MIVTKNPINVSWLRGFFESDGCFTGSFSGKYFKPVAKFSQKNNSNLLCLIQDFLLLKGISATFDISKGSSNRAPALRIQGRYKVEQFIQLLSSNGNEMPFLGKTQRNFLVFRQILHNPNLTRQEIQSLLRYNRSNDGDVIIEKSNIVREIHESYQNHQKWVLHKINNKLEPGFISGLLDGDGSYGVSFCFREEGTMKRKKVRWNEFCVLTTDGCSYLTIQAFISHIQSDNRIYSLCGGRAFTVFLRKQELITKLIDIHNKFPLLGNYSKGRFQLILDYRNLKNDGKLLNKKAVIPFFTKYFSIVKCSKLKYTLRECIYHLESNNLLL